MGGSGRESGWRETPRVEAARLGGLEKLPDLPPGRDLFQETNYNVVTIDFKFRQ